MSAIEVDTPPPFSRLPEPLTAALRELAGAGRILVALDFDGTLAPLVDDPATARALPRAREAVERLAAVPRTRIALVSGRSLGSLRQVAEPSEEMLLVGSHGAEAQLDAGDEFSPLNASESADLGTLRGALDGVAAEFAHVWVESKPVGFALHTRLADPADARRAEDEAARRVAEQLSAREVHVREGKNVVEFSIRRTTKGDAIDLLRDYTESDAVFFAGDDVTDEDAFQALGPDDIGVKCGEGTTSASFRVDTPEDVAAVLTQFAEFREGDVHEQ